MKTALVRLSGIALVVAVTLTFATSVQAATPMFGCATSMLFVADRAGELQPAKHELLLTLTHLPGYVPIVTSKAGYDFCLYYERAQMDDTIPPINTGTVKAVVYRLNRRGRWKKITKIPSVAVVDNIAIRCKNVRKALVPETVTRWIFTLNGMPALDFFDMYEVEGSVMTGGAGELITGPG